MVGCGPCCRPHWPHVLHCVHSPSLNDIAIKRGRLARTNLAFVLRHLTCKTTPLPAPVGLQYAIKKVRLMDAPQASSRILREVNLLSRLAHPNVVSWCEGVHRAWLLGRACWQGMRLGVEEVTAGGRWAADSFPTLGTLYRR